MRNFFIFVSLLFSVVFVGCRTPEQFCSSLLDLYNVPVSVEEDEDEADSPPIIKGQDSETDNAPWGAKDALKLLGATLFCLFGLCFFLFFIDRKEPKSDPVAAERYVQALVNEIYEELDERKEKEKQKVIQEAARQAAKKKKKEVAADVQAAKDAAWFAVRKAARDAAKEKRAELQQS